MTNKHPEALRLADELFCSVQFEPQMSEDEPGGYFSQVDAIMDAAAAELRRLHEVNAELVEALGAIVEEPKNTMSDNKALREMVRVAKAALAKAQGENND